MGHVEAQGSPFVRLDQGNRRRSVDRAQIIQVPHGVRTDVRDGDVAGASQPVAEGHLEFPVVVPAVIAQGQRPLARLAVGAGFRIDEEVVVGPPVLEAGPQEEVVDQFAVQLQVPAEALGVAERPCDAGRQVALPQPGIPDRRSEAGFGAVRQLIEGRHQEADPVDEKARAASQDRPGAWADGVGETGPVGGVPLRGEGVPLQPGAEIQRQAVADGPLVLQESRQVGLAAPDRGGFAVAQVQDRPVVQAEPGHWIEGLVAGVGLPAEIETGLELVLAQRPEVIQLGELAPRRHARLPIEERSRDPVDPDQAGIVAERLDVVLELLDREIGQQQASGGELVRILDRVEEGPAAQVGGRGLGREGVEAEVAELFRIDQRGQRGAVPVRGQHVELVEDRQHFPLDVPFQQRLVRVFLVGPHVLVLGRVQPRDAIGNQRHVHRQARRARFDAAHPARPAPDAGREVLQIEAELGQLRRPRLDRGHRAGEAAVLRIVGA